jgi:uncharacterized protein (DUF488 family)
MTPSFITIGVYGFDEAGFFDALRATQVDTFCDIRRRRGVRGSTYAFANSQRLQARLGELGIRYVHRPDLAPSLDVRHVQDRADQVGRTAKRRREVLDPAFVEAYRIEVLDGFDSRQFIEELGEARVVALFCVERQPAACHRSLVAERLANDLGVSVKHV